MAMLSSVNTSAVSNINADLVLGFTLIWSWQEEELPRAFLGAHALWNTSFDSTRSRPTSIPHRPASPHSRVFEREALLQQLKRRLPKEKFRCDGRHWLTPKNTY